MTCITHLWCFFFYFISGFKKPKLGCVLPLSSKLPESSYTASSLHPSYAKLNGGKSWCARNNEPNKYITVRILFILRLLYSFKRLLNSAVTHAQPRYWRPYATRTATTATTAEKIYFLLAFYFSLWVIRVLFSTP